MTGEREKAAQTYQEWIASYPRSLCSTSRFGQRTQRAGTVRESGGGVSRDSLRLDPGGGTPYGNLANSLLALQRFDEARQIDPASAGDGNWMISSFAQLSTLWLLFETTLQGWRNSSSGSRASRKRTTGFRLRPTPRHTPGRLGKARELTRQSVDSAVRADSKETGAIWLENAALREAAFGNADGCQANSSRGIKAGSSQSGREAGSCAGLCHGWRCGASRIAGARPEQTLPAGHADAVAVAACD